MKEIKEALLRQEAAFHRERQRMLKRLMNEERKRAEALEKRLKPKKKAAAPKRDVLANWPPAGYAVVPERETGT